MPNNNFTTSCPAKDVTALQSNLDGPPEANRRRLPDERAAVTHHFSIGGSEGYLTVGVYPNGQPGEVFIRMAKAGSTISGLMECFGAVTSVGLQHGVPLRVFCSKLSHTRFEPSGWTGNAEIGYAKSVMDYIFRWMDLRFLSGKQQASHFCVANDAEESAKDPKPDSAAAQVSFKSDREMEASGETHQPGLNLENCSEGRDRGLQSKPEFPPF